MKPGIVTISFRLIILLFCNPSSIHAKDREERFMHKGLYFYQLYENFSGLSDVDSLSDASLMPFFLCSKNIEELNRKILNKQILFSSISIEPFLKMVVNLIKHKKYAVCEVLGYDRLSSHVSSEFLFALGFANLKLKREAQAIDCFNKVLHNAGDLAWYAKYYMAYINLIKGYFEKSKQILTQLLSDNSGKNMMVRYQLAQILYRDKNFSELAKELEFIQKENVILSDQQSRRLSLLTAEKYFAENNYSSALDIFNKALQEAEYFDKIFLDSLLYRIGFCYYKKGDYLNAISHFSKIGYSNSLLSQMVYFYTAVCFLLLKNFDDAKRFFEASATLSFNMTVQQCSLLQLGKINYSARSYDEAIIWFKKLEAISKNTPFEVQVTNFLETAYFFSLDLDKSLIYFDNQDELSPKAKLIYAQKILQKSISLLQEKNDLEAIDFIDKYINMHPNSQMSSEQLLLIKAVAYIRLSNFEDAKKVLKNLADKKLASEKNLYFILYYLGCADFALANYDEALKSFLSCKNAKGFPMEFKKDVYVKLGDCFFAKRNYRKAKELYASSLIANEPYSRMQVGIISFLQGEYAHSVYNFSEVIEKTENSEYKEICLYYSGMANIKRKAFHNALKDFKNLEKIAKSQKYLVASKLYSALSFLETKDYESAETIYKQIFEDEGNREYWNSAISGLKEVYIAKKQEAAFSAYLQSVRNEANNPTDYALMQTEIIKSLFYKQQYNELVDLVKSLKESQMSQEIVFYFAESLFILNCYKEAMMWFEKISPENQLFYERSLQRLATLYHNQEDFQNEMLKYEELYELVHDICKKNFFLNKILELASYLQHNEKIFIYVTEVLNKDYEVELKKFAALKLAEVRIREKNFSEALELLVKFEDNLNTILSAEISYNIANIYFLQQEYHKSIEKVYFIAKNNRRHSLVVEKSFLLLAENFVGLSQFYQARATLVSLKNNCTDDNIRLKALEKLAEIETCLK